MEPRRYTLQLALGGTVLAGVAFSLGLAVAGDGADGFAAASRYTARVSFLLFLPVYLASTFARLGARTGRDLMRQRRGLGLAFAGAHTVHLAALMGGLILSAEPIRPLGLIPGGLAYALMGAMAATSNDAALRLLGPARWRLLHRIGIHYLWLIFTLTPVTRIAAGKPEYVLSLAICLAALGLRLFAMQRIRKNASRA